MASQKTYSTDSAREEGGPKHVAIIMDGNGRWAKRRMLPRHAGHKAGLTAAKKIIEESGKAGIRYLTLFAFSSENWHRPQGEVSKLMELFLEALQNEIDELHERGVQLRFIGNVTPFGAEIQQRVERAEAQTRNNSGMTLIVAVGYGGQWDITQAARQVATKARNGQLEPEALTVEEFARYLTTGDLPAPDLFIRTGGEVRISNFLLWDLAYTELYFSDVLWPDFDSGALRLAIDWYRQRQRRFGSIDNLPVESESA
ncbi:MAG: polyprenyl diphosphate synthase [Gammaproteobacteria bacterium]